MTLEAVYREHGAAIRGMARRLCGDDRADDITQEVFLHLWRHPERFDPGRGSMRTYLLTVCHGKAIDILRSEGSRRARELTSTGIEAHEPPAVDLDLLHDERRHLIDRCLALLPTEQREAIVIAYYGGCSYRRAAQIIGQPEGTTKARIRSGLIRLKAALTELDPDRLSPHRVTQTAVAGE